MISTTFWKDRTVFLTGHTGFKGSWLALWLAGMQAKVFGYALPPPTKPSLFEQAGVRGHLAGHVENTICDTTALTREMRNSSAEVVFHLAAQPLVMTGYEQPVLTFQDNVVGTASVLEAARHCPEVRAIVVITTDKCYENHEWWHPYRETDRLGGHDPYSASKACAELVAACYRSSFFQKKNIRLATARAGNVIGGGDWAENRLVPDAVRAFQRGTPLQLRYPQSVRPWQHVLEPLAGYLILAQHLLTPDGEQYGKAYNFGPGDQGDATVRHIAETMASFWPEARIALPDGATEHFHEAGQLRLDISLAKAELGWHPVWDLATTLRETAQWYQEQAAGVKAGALCQEQIARFVAAARSPLP